MDNALEIRFDKGSQESGFQRIIDAVNELPSDADSRPRLWVVKPPEDAAAQARRNGATLMLWEMFQQVTARYDSQVEQNLKISRVIHELKLRVDALERVAGEQREALHKYDRSMHFFCVGCSKEFDLPETEAVALGFASLCPSCHGWALPGVPEASPPAAAPLIEATVGDEDYGTTRRT
jgi:hypothetical protein